MTGRGVGGAYDGRAKSAAGETFDSIRVVVVCEKKNDCVHRRGGNMKKGRHTTSLASGLRMMCVGRERG